MKVRVSTLYSFATALLFASGVIFYVKELQVLSYAIMAIAGIIIVAMRLFFEERRQQNSKRSKGLMILLLSMIVICILSSAMEGSLSLLFNGVMFCAVVYFIALFFRTTSLPTHTKLKIVAINVTSISVILMILCLLLANPLATDITYGYQGIFDNPNKLGVCLVPVATITGTLLITPSGTSLSKIQKVINAIIFALSFLLIIISSSRTALLSVILSMGVVFVLFIRSMKLTRRTFKVAVTILLLVLIGGIILYNSGFFNEYILSKSIRMSGSGDLFSGRSELWGYALKHSKIIGYNEEFSEEFALGTHNTYLAYMVRFGYIFAGLFFLGTVLMLIEAYRFHRTSRNNSLALIPFALTLSTMLIYMTEQALTSINTFAMLVCFSITCLRVWKRVLVR